MYTREAARAACNGEWRAMAAVVWWLLDVNDAFRVCVGDWIFFLSSSVMREESKDV